MGALGKVDWVVRNGWASGRAGGRCDLPTSQRNLHMGLKKMNPNQLIAMSSTDGWELEFQNFQEIAQIRIKEMKSKRFQDVRQPGYRWRRVLA